MLTDPQDALAEQNTVATALTGIVGMARTVRALAAAGPTETAPHEVDDLVHLLLGVASLGEAIARLAAPGTPASASDAPGAPGEWLR
jgi:hypothetical protein